MPGGVPETPPLGPCPRCGNRDVRRVLRLETGGGIASETYLALRWGQVTARGTFGAYVCRGCGHTELYLSNPEELDRI